MCIKGLGLQALGLFGSRGYRPLLPSSCHSLWQKSLRSMSKTNTVHPYIMTEGLLKFEVCQYRCLLLECQKYKTKSSLDGPWPCCMLNKSYASYEANRMLCAKHYLILLAWIHSTRQKNSKRVYASLECEHFVVIIAIWQRSHALFSASTIAYHHYFLHLWTLRITKHWRSKVTMILDGLRVN